MFNTMVYTKALGALCGALLIFLLGQWLADTVYKPEGRDLAQAYAIDTGEDDAVEEVAELTFDEAFLMADADAGARLWSQCRACHQLEAGRNGVGPYLYNVVGRAAHGVDGFNYSGALPDLIWSPEEISKFIASPRTYAPGTSMSYAGMGDLQDRANLIAHLVANSPDYVPSATAAVVVEEAPAVPAEAPAAEEAAAPVVEAPAVEPAPAPEAAPEAAPAVEAPAEEAAIETPAIETPAIETPAVEAPASVAEVPAIVAPVAQAPVAEVPAAAAPVAEAPAAAVVEAPAAPVAEAPAVEMSQFAMQVANADLEAGARVFRQCQSCHVVNAATNRVGPHLLGIVGREVGAVEGFRYSGKLPAGIWSLDNLDAYLTRPRDYAPGTSMVFQGLRDVEDRVNVIGYLAAQN